MTYDEAVQFVYGMIKPKPERLDADRPTRMKQLLSLMGNPQEQYPIMHVTGTKGKGSVCAMLTAALQANGYRLGLYTSPYLQDFRERIQVNRQLIPKTTFSEIVEDIQPFMKQVEGLGFPETVAAIAFQYFAQAGVDIAIVEVHIGGRSDATNMVEPLVSVITSISYDHMDVIGDTLEAIAQEKAGIIKAETPIVSAPQQPQVETILRETAKELDASITIVGKEWEYSLYDYTTNETRIITNENAIYETNLLGGHQAENLAVVLATLDIIEELGFTLTKKQIQAGLKAVAWAGRMELIGRVLLDSAHNAESLASLRESITILFPETRLVLVYTAKGSKDIRGGLAAILPIVHHLVLTRVEYPPTASLGQLETVVRDIAFEGSMVAYETVGDALQSARQLAGSEGLIVVTGSMYLVGEVRTLLGMESGA